LLSWLPGRGHPTTHLNQNQHANLLHPRVGSASQVGDSFVLNCLGDGEYNAVLKHFLQRFPPGADRFEGIGWRSADNGCPVLDDAIAYMECKV